MVFSHVAGGLACNGQWLTDAGSHQTGLGRAFLGWGVGDGCV